MNTSILLLFSLFLLLSVSLSERCNPSDKKVLLSIKETLNNPYILASWKNTTDCCDWYTVTCDDTTNRINSLTIFSGELSGEIPVAVGDLPYLTMLDLNRLTDLHGKIPTTISKLVKLTFVRLSYTNLSGPIPAFFSQLKALTFLDLSNNDLTGTIPASLSQLSNLDALRLDGNKLTGAIPSSFGTFTGKIPELYLSHNQLSGVIPKSLGNVDFPRIDFSYNNFIGDASPILSGPKKSIEIIDLSWNALAFDLTTVDFPTGLTSLDLSHNKIFGSLPAAMTSLNLLFLNVSYNQLCGKIPVGGKLQSFDSTSYFHNKCLCGAPLDGC